MFPQPSGKATGPAEFLPLLLALNDPSPGDPLSGSAAQQTQGVIPASDIPQFLADLAAGFDSDTLADVITPTLSLFFQRWFSITPSPDLIGDHWRKYLGAVAALTQVKPIAQIVRRSYFDFADADANIADLDRTGDRCTKTGVAVFARSLDQVERLPKGICVYLIEWGVC